MSKKLGSQFNYHSGCAGVNGNCAGILTDRDLSKRRIDHSLIAVWEEGSWLPEIRVPWAAVGICRVKKPKACWVAVGSNGAALVIDEMGARPERIDTEDEPIRKIGLLRSARTIDGKAFAAGMIRQLYRRDGENAWTRVDSGCRRPAGETAIVGFEAVDGFTHNDLYGVGWKGEIWHSSGDRWTQIDSPTGRILSNVCCAPNGIVYACGRQGILVSGRGDKWETVENVLTTDDLWGIAWYGGKLYLATLYSLIMYDGDRLSWVNCGEVTPDSCYHLSASDTHLWSFGAFEVVVYDGQKWKRFD